MQGGESPCFLSVMVFDHLLLGLPYEYPCHSSDPNSNRSFFFVVKGVERKGDPRVIASEALAMGSLPSGIQT